MKEIYIVTHTQATHHIDRLVGGWYDSELTEKGKADAGSCGEKLKEQGVDGTPIISSDLTRARQTALAIAGCLGISISYDARLREMFFGDAKG